jgi:4-amino-4-deoxy-L-arabinose transferase-like glycosyltransferase
MKPSAASKGIAAVVIAATALIAFTRLGATDLWAPDEPRYGQVAEELRSFEQGALGLVLPHLNGEAYTQKPPLYFWLAALAGAPGGRVSEFSARLPSALAGIAVALLVIGFGTGLLDRRAAILGAASCSACSSSPTGSAAHSSTSCLRCSSCWRSSASGAWTGGRATRNAT